eukprot:640284_1
MRFGAMNKLIFLKPASVLLSLHCWKRLFETKKNTEDTSSNTQDVSIDIDLLEDNAIEKTHPIQRTMMMATKRMTIKATAVIIIMVPRVIKMTVMTKKMKKRSNDEDSMYSMKDIEVIKQRAEILKQTEEYKTMVEQKNALKDSELIALIYYTDQNSACRQMKLFQRGKIHENKWKELYFHTTNGVIKLHEVFHYHNKEQAQIQRLYHGSSEIKRFYKLSQEQRFLKTLWSFSVQFGVALSFAMKNNRGSVWVMDNVYENLYSGGLKGADVAWISKHCEAEVLICPTTFWDWKLMNKEEILEKTTWIMDINRVNVYITDTFVSNKDPFCTISDTELPRMASDYRFRSLSQSSNPNTASISPQTHNESNTPNLSFVNYKQEEEEKTESNSISETHHVPLYFMQIMSVDLDEFMVQVSVDTAVNKKRKFFIKEIGTNGNNSVVVSVRIPKWQTSGSIYVDCDEEHGEVYHLALFESKQIKDPIQNCRPIRFVMAKDEQMPPHNKQYKPNMIDSSKVFTRSDENAQQVNVYWETPSASFGDISYNVLSQSKEDMISVASLPYSIAIALLHVSFRVVTVCTVSGMVYES